MARKPMQEGTRRDLYQEVTNEILAIMESGSVPWQKSWTSAQASSEQARAHASFMMPVNASSGRPYSGMNVLTLWASKAKNEFETHGWLTFKQATALGGSVRKGSKGTLVTYMDRFIPKDEAKKAEEEGREPQPVFMLKGFTVFNVAQIDGIPSEKLKVSNVAPDPVQLEARTARIIGNAGLTLRHGGDQAFYSPTTDHVQMPHPDQFTSHDAYSRVLFHEMTHWTGHSDRLARDLSGRFGSKSYAREELVAELGSAFMSASMGIEPDAKDHAAYLQHWIEALKEDKKFIFQAASAATKASNFLLGFERVHELDVEVEWEAKEPGQWSPDEREAAAAALAVEQAEGRFTALTLDEYGGMKHRIWEKQNPSADNDDRKPSATAAPVALAM